MISAGWLVLVALAELIVILYLGAWMHSEHASWDWLRECMEARDWEAIDFWRTRARDGSDLPRGEYNDPPLSLVFDLMKAGYDFDRDPRLT